MGWKETLQVVLFVLSWFPVGFLIGSTLFGVGGTYPQDFSIYNEEYNGLSDFRTRLETDQYTVQAIQSSMSVVSRYNGSAVLVIMGPVRDFSFDAILTLTLHLQAGGSVLIADDFGSANSSFYWFNEYLINFFGGDQLAAFGVQGFLSYTGGVLYDLDSYYESPRLPVIHDFDSLMYGNMFGQGVNALGGLHLNWASTLSPRCLLGAAGVGWSTVRAWSETDVNSTDPVPDDYEWAGRLPVAGAIELGPGRLFAMSDPSAFMNDMWQEFPGNEQFAMNVINWLTHGDTSVPILFSEQLLVQPWNSAELFYGLYLGRALWMTTNIFMAPFYPLTTAIGIKKYLPDMKKPEVKSVSDVFMRRGQTYFSERMTYYRTEGNYARVIKMLYRKLRRGLKRKHMWQQYDPRRLWDLYRYKDPSMKEGEFFKKIKRIEEISSDPSMKIKESEMMELFFWMRNIQALLIESK
ncbi:MAG: hypothetical protein JSW61_10515 [Candidatus Thorarchaeota archaeon]|nr:MAG: hypothetical protein JSW61_10515 [Candidatus Thorarchaeota archaeon]